MDEAVKAQGSELICKAAWTLLNLAMLSVHLHLEVYFISLGCVLLYRKYLYFKIERFNRALLLFVCFLTPMFLDSMV